MANVSVKRKTRKNIDHQIFTVVTAGYKTERKQLVKCYIKQNIVIQYDIAESMTKYHIHLTIEYLVLGTI